MEAVIRYLMPLRRGISFIKEAIDVISLKELGLGLLLYARIHNKHFLLLMLCLLMLSACSSPGSIAAANPVQEENTFIRTELYCGLSKPDGGIVSEIEWQKFLSEIVTPVFKEGYTVFNAEGRWMDTRTKRTIIEKTKVIVFIYKPNAAAAASIDRIIKTYKQKFQQQAVMRLDYRVSVRF